VNEQKRPEYTEPLPPVYLNPCLSSCQREQVEQIVREEIAAVLHGPDAGAFVTSGLVTEPMRPGLCEAIGLPPYQTACPFKPGDQVMLNSGGPSMTVENVRGDIVF
jgi:hypothetical protein